MSPDYVLPEPSWSVSEVSPGEFTISGEVDAHSAPMVLDRLASFSGPEVVLDLGGVTFMDSSGLRVVVQLHQRSLAGGAKLVIASPSRPVIRLFAIAGLSGLLQPDDR